MFSGAACKAVLTAGWPGVPGTAWGSKGSAPPAAGRRGSGSWDRGCAAGEVAAQGSPAPCCLRLFIPVPVGTSWLSGLAFALAFALLYSWHLYFPTSDVSCNYAGACSLAVIRPLKSPSSLSATCSTQGTDPLGCPKFRAAENEGQAGCSMSYALYNYSH